MAKKSSKHTRKNILKTALAGGLLVIGLLVFWNENSFSGPASQATQPSPTLTSAPTPPSTESMKDKDAITKKLTGLASGQLTTYKLNQIKVSVKPDIFLTSQDVCVDKTFWIVSHSRKGFNIFEGNLNFTGYHSYRCDSTGCGVTRWDRPVNYLPKEMYTEIKNSSGVQILKIIGKNNSYNPEFPNAPKAYSGTPGAGKIGAVINLPGNPIYSGVVIAMKLTDTLTEQVFDQILNSIKIIE